MMTLRTKLLVVAVLALAGGPSFAEIEDPDGDWPTGLAFFVESVVSGNPLDQGDVIYGVRGTHRFFRGDLGLELGVGLAEPTSPFVRGLGNDADLVLVDLSVVWYANYAQMYSQARQSDPWHRGRRVKPEVVVFGGPGWASLRVDDAFPGSPLPDAAKDYFTLNGGVGVEIHWMRTDEGRGWDHRTSRWYLRPEVRGRWFAGDGGEVDWSVGLSLGVQFGRRPSEHALRLKADEGRKNARQLLSTEIKPFVGTRQQEPQEADGLWSKAMEHRRALEELKAHAVSCGPRCDDVREQLDEVIRELNDALSRLRPGVG
jgi:hypothetical protein